MNNWQFCRGSIDLRKGTRVWLACVDGVGVCAGQWDGNQFVTRGGRTPGVYAYMLRTNLRKPKEPENQGWFRS